MLEYIPLEICNKTLLFWKALPHSGLIMLSDFLPQSIHNYFFLNEILLQILLHMASCLGDIIFTRLFNLGSLYMENNKSLCQKMCAWSSSSHNNICHFQSCVLVGSISNMNHTSQREGCCWSSAFLGSDCETWWLVMFTFSTKVSIMASDFFP